MPRFPTLLLFAALPLVGCAAGPPPARTPAAGAPEPAASTDPTEPAAAAPDDAAAGLRRALARAETDPAVRDSLRLFVECQVDAGLQSMQVFGSGLGIWNDERQFSLDDGKLGALLAVLRAADFPGLADSYGGAPSPPKPEPAPAPGGADDDGEAMATVLTCRIDLGLDGREKRVVQLARGEQSPVLKQLARDLLAIGEEAARAGGVGAASLRDGLEKIARGELAPETWRLVLHSKPEETGGSGETPGFLLTVAGPRASTRVYDPATGYAEPVVLELSEDEVQALARELAAHDPGPWPVNLWAPDYVDLSVEVLNHERAVQARRFAGLAPDAHGQRQRDFEAVREALERLHEEVLRRGVTPPAPPPAPPGR
ncbi:MAG TPA: hypothetical protein VNJ70_02820 [Thermoanaerobaculia bacterium]|nr:hypothetical protein [Thermoanaerobaculia bacterium]